MPDVAKHAWTHRSRSAGGTDPLPGAAYAHLFNAGDITAGVNVTGDDHYTLPYHEDETPTWNVAGGFELQADGRVLLPGRGLYYCWIAARFSDTDWQTENFWLGFTFTTASQVFDDVFGSQELGGEALDNSMSHDGGGLFNTSDRRKPEMQNNRMFLVGSAVSAVNLPFSVTPWYYSETASQTTTWQHITAVIVQVSTEQGTTGP